MMNFNFPKDRKTILRWGLYLIILILCIVAIWSVLYMQSNNRKQAQEGIVAGVQGDNAKEEYNRLKEEFKTICTNDFENMQGNDISVKKIHDNYDIVVTAYSYNQNKENCVLDVAIPYINADNEVAASINARTEKEFKERAEYLANSTNNENTIYNVKYKAYLQNNILSLVIRSELKEANKNQRVTIKTYNYNIIEQKELSLQDLLNIKDIRIVTANKKIQEEIKEIQEQNEAFAKQGHNLYNRDYTSDMYKVENTEQYFLGKDNRLYLVYSYGNNDYTSEVDVVIFD